MSACPDCRESASGVCTMHNGSTTAPDERQAGLRSAVEDVLTTLERVVTDSESQHPGGWGPDVTTVADLRDCQAVLRAALAAQVPAQEERQVTALSGALAAVSDDLGKVLRKSEIYRLGLADAAARANTAEAQRDQAWRNLDMAHDDIAALLRESGLGDYARPVSTHDVIRDELLPWVRRAARALGVQSKEEGAG